jgi:hypothetical protein
LNHPVYLTKIAIIPLHVIKMFVCYGDSVFSVSCYIKLSFKDIPVQTGNFDSYLYAVWVLLLVLCRTFFYMPVCTHRDR